MWTNPRRTAAKPQRGRVLSTSSSGGNTSNSSVVVPRSQSSLNVPHSTKPAKSGLAKFEDLRYAKFAFDGVQGLKHAVLVPDHLELTPLVMEEVCTALDREMPSMFLTGLSSLSHPSKLTSPQLLKCPGFSPLLAEARRSLGMDSIHGSNESANQPDKLIDIVNDVLEKKIVTMVGNITAAAFRTNVWTFTGPRISNFEIFIQHCLETGEAGAFRLVAAHMQDKAYMECAEAKQLMKDLFVSSQGLSAEAVRALSPLLLSSSLWDPAVNIAHEEFAQSGYEYWSFVSLDQQTTAGHPIVQWPWPHGDLFLFFYREENIRGAAEAEADWEFATEHWLDEEAANFLPQAFAPTCSVCIGSPTLGQSGMKRQLLQNITRACPVVIIDNTSSIGKQLGTAVQDIRNIWDAAPHTACRPFLDDGRASSLGHSCIPLDFLQALSAAKILQHAEQVFTASGTDDKLTLSDVVVLLDAVKRRPQAFRETVCVVDPLTESAHEAIKKLMSVFTSTQACAGESVSTELQRKLATRAWDLHLRLARSALHKWRVAILLLASIALLLLACTIIAILRLWCELRDVLAPGSGGELGTRIGEWLSNYKTVLDVFSVAAPVIVIVLMTIQTGFHVSQNWATMHMSASWVVAELYLFLGSVAPYDKGAAVNQKRFLRRLRGMVKGSSSSGMDEDNLDQGMDADASPAIELDKLNREVGLQLYGIRRGCCPCRCRALRSCCGTRCCSSGNNLAQADLVEPVSAESYMEVRIQPLRHRYLKTVWKATVFRKCTNALLMLVICVSVLLGSTEKFYVWLPVAAAIANVLANLSNWLTPPAFLPAVNNALMLFQKLDLLWQGSDLRENRSEATKRLMIRTTESAVLDVQRALARAMPMMPEGLEDNEDMKEMSSKIMTPSEQASSTGPTASSTGSDGTLYTVVKPRDSLLGG